MKQLFRRLASLLLVFAMVMSLALTAAAADISTNAAEDTSSAVAEQETGFDIPEAQELTDQEEEGSSEDKSSEDASSDDAAPADGDEQSEDAAPAESAEEAAEESGEAPEGQEEADASVAETEGDESEAVEPQSSEPMGWSIVKDSNNVSHFVFRYVPARSSNANAVLTAAANTEENTDETDEANIDPLVASSTAHIRAADGLFALPEQKEVVLDSKKYTFSAGVYEFDEDGLLIEKCDVAETKSKKVTLVRSVKDQEADEEQLVEEVTEKRMVVSKKGDKLPAVTKDNVTTISPLSTLLAKKYQNLYYYEGEKYTGFMRLKEGGELYTVNNGKETLHNGCLKPNASYSTYIVNFQPGTFDRLWYYQGKPWTGYFRSDDATDPEALYIIDKGKAAKYNGQMKKTDDPLFNAYLVNYKPNTTFDKLWYVAGHKYTGFFLGRNGKLYTIKNGKETLYTGEMKKITFGGTTYDKYVVKYTATKYTDAKLTGLYYEKGLLLTGASTVTMSNGKKPAGLYLYVNGKRQTLKNGWYKLPRPANEFYKPFVYYYVKSNKAITGNHRLKAIGNRGGKYKDSSTYRFTFRSNGTLVTNLFQYQPSLMKSGKFKIYADHTNYTCTILAYNSSTKKYDIPCKSFVVAMSKSKDPLADDGTKYGNYPLASGRGSWYRYLSKKGTYCWYSSSVHIWGSGSMFHSANYYDFKASTSEAKRHHLMIAHIYNQLGTNVTAHCVRAQTINIKLITTMYKASSKFVDHGRSCSKNIRVYLTKSNKNKNLPFGQMTLTNNNDLNGYVIQRANIGYGKDHVADPTDTYCKGEPIYIAKSKVTSKSKCTKIKMISSSNYSCNYGPA